MSRSRKSVSRSVKIAEFYGGFCPFETPIVSNRLTKAREARNVSIKRAVERSLLWNLLARSFYWRRGKGWPRAQERRKKWWFPKPRNIACLALNRGKLNRQFDSNWFLRVQKSSIASTRFFFFPSTFLLFVKKIPTLSDYLNNSWGFQSLTFPKLPSNL